MVAAHVTRDQLLAVADDVIRNDAGIGALRDQVEKLHRQYSAAASSQADRVGP
jgi:dephospho-CoA kinase